MNLLHEDDPNPRTAGWSWADLGITEAEAQAIPVGAEVEEYNARKAAPAIRGLVSNPGVAVLQRVAAELVAMGVQVRYVDGWGSRGYLLLRPVGLINHWIVSTYRPGAVAPTLGLIVAGHSRLAGPLANLCLGFDGTVYVVAALSANHGGVGQWRDISGNDRWFGVECEGGPLLQPAQLAVLPKLNAAVGKALDRDPADWCISHQEYAPRRKVDIGGYMPPIRTQAAAIYRGAPAGTTTQPDQTTTTQEEFLMALSQYDQEHVRNTVVGIDKKINDLTEALYLHKPDGTRWPGYGLDGVNNNVVGLYALLSAHAPESGDPAAVAEAVAKAIPSELAQKVADELAKRLAS